MDIPGKRGIQIIRFHRHAAQLVIFVQIRVHPLHLFGRQLQLHAAHRVHQPGKGLKIHHGIMINLRAEIPVDRFHQKLRPPIGIRRVQPVPVMPRDIHIHIPQQRRHMHRLRTVADGDQDHRIRSSLRPRRSGIASDQQNARHTVLLHRPLHALIRHNIHLIIHDSHSQIQPAEKQGQHDDEKDKKLPQPGMSLLLSAVSFLFPHLSGPHSVFRLRFRRLHIVLFLPFRRLHIVLFLPFRRLHIILFLPFHGLHIVPCPRFHGLHIVHFTLQKLFQSSSDLFHLIFRILRLFPVFRRISLLSHPFLLLSGS